MNEVPRPSSFADAPVLRALFAAVQFLTRLPVPSDGAASAAIYAADLRRGVVYFPLIGALIGALTAAAVWAFAQVLPFPVAILAALACEALLTGALHEDAVADFCDAFGGGATRDDILRIMKDSRIGSFGVVGLGLAVALRAIALIALANPLTAALVLVVSGALGRLAAVALMALVPPVEGRPGLSTDVGSNVHWSAVGMGALLISPVLFAAARHDAGALAAAVTAIVLFLAWLRSRLLARIGGVTGDCLGFAAYAGIVITTLAFARLH